MWVFVYADAADDDDDGVVVWCLCKSVSLGLINDIYCKYLRKTIAIGGDHFARESPQRKWLSNHQIQLLCKRADTEKGS